MAVRNSGPRRTSVPAAPSRRSALGATAAGLAALAGGGAVALASPSLAEASTRARPAPGPPWPTGTDWFVLTPQPATTGQTAATATTQAINNALHACQPGQVVYLSAGLYPTDGPILVPPGVGLRGPVGATQSGDDSNLTQAAVLQPQGGWSPLNPYAPGSPDLPFSKYGDNLGGVITLIDIASNGSASTVNSRMDIRDLWIDGHLLLAEPTPPLVDGIASWGQMNAVAVSRVGIYETPGRGIGAYNNKATTTGPSYPDGWYLDTVVVQQVKGDGIYGRLVDSTLINCHAQYSGGNGIYLYGGTNNRLIGCRADLSGQWGFYLEAFSGGSGAYDANTLTSCGTQYNNYSGLYAANTGGGGPDGRCPVIAVACSFDMDGVTGNPAGGGDAGMETFGAVRLVAVDCNVIVGTQKVPGGSPRYAIASYPDGSGNVPALVQVSGSFLNSASSTLINDAAASTKAPKSYMRVDPSNSCFTGGPFLATSADPVPTPLPVRRPDYLGAAQDLFTHPAGTVAATLPRFLATSAAAPPSSTPMTSGTLYVVAVGIEAGVTISGCTLFTNSQAANGLTNGWCALLDQDMTVLAVTADQGSSGASGTASTWSATGRAYPLPFGHAHTTTYSGLHYVGVMAAVSGSTPTMPLFTGTPELAVGIASQVPAFAGTSGTGLGAPPAVGTHQAAVAPTGSYVFYAALTA